MATTITKIDAGLGKKADDVGGVASFGAPGKPLADAYKAPRQNDQAPVDPDTSIGTFSYPPKPVQTGK